MGDRGSLLSYWQVPGHDNCTPLGVHAYVCVCVRARVRVYWATCVTQHISPQNVGFLLSVLMWPITKDCSTVYSNQFVQIAFLYFTASPQCEHRPENMI
jgi:hypothetical protein